MMKLTPHHRIRISNRLAILAAVLLLVSSISGFETRQQVQSARQDSSPAVKVDNADDHAISDSAEPKRRSLNLGLLLFRRG